MTSEKTKKKKIKVVKMNYCIRCQRKINNPLSVHIYIHHKFDPGVVYKNGMWSFIELIEKEQKIKKALENDERVRAWLKAHNEEIKN